MNSGKHAIDDASGEPRSLARSKEHAFVLALSFLALVPLVVLGTLVHPDPRGFGTHEQLGLPACRMIEWFGVPCPGCGVTTSVALATHGHFLDAFKNQPFGLIVALAIPSFTLWALGGHLAGRDLFVDLHSARVGKLAILLAIALGLAWIYKIALVRGLIG